MDVICTQEQLQRALAQSARAVATKTSLPSLSNVLMRPEDGRLRIAATNLELGITTWIDADVRDAGDTAPDGNALGVSVDARLLSELVATLPAGNVRLKRAQNRYNLDVSSGEGKHAIKAVQIQAELLDLSSPKLSTEPLDLSSTKLETSNQPNPIPA